MKTFDKEINRGFVNSEYKYEVALSYKFFPDLSKSHIINI